MVGGWWWCFLGGACSPHVARVPTYVPMPPPRFRAILLHRNSYGNYAFVRMIDEYENMLLSLCKLGVRVGGVYVCVLFYVSVMFMWLLMLLLCLCFWLYVIMLMFICLYHVYVYICVDNMFMCTVC